MLNSDEESNLEKKVEELQTVVSRRNKQIKELKVKLGKRERDLDSLEKDFADEKRQYERLFYESECRVKALEASLNWWECKDRKQRVAAEQMKRRKRRWRLREGLGLKKLGTKSKEIWRRSRNWTIPNYDGIYGFDHLQWNL